MKKLNNKGFTVIEVVLCFALILIIVTGMLAIAMTYRNRLEVETIKSDMNEYKINLTMDIQNDLKKKVIDSVTDCTTVSKKCVKLNFKDTTSKELLVSNTNPRNKYIKYGAIKYPIIDKLPSKQKLEEIGEPEENAVNYQSIFLMESVDQILTSSVADTKTIYHINIPIRNIELEEDYGITVTIVKDN